MGDRKFDARKIGGNRVLAECQVKLDRLDPFAHFEHSLKGGHIVFNIRGGCLYLTEQISTHNLHKIFPDGNTTVFTKLVLNGGADWPAEALHNMRVTYIRMRKNENREGIVIKFVDTTPNQMSALERAVRNFPQIGLEEELSVPFDQIFTLKRNLELGDNS